MNATLINIFFRESVKIYGKLGSYIGLEMLGSNYRYYLL